MLNWLLGSQDHRLTKTKQSIMSAKNILYNNIYFIILILMMIVSVYSTQTDLTISGFGIYLRAYNIIFSTQQCLIDVDVHISQTSVHP